MENITVKELEYKILSGTGGYFRVECELGKGIVDINGEVVILPRFHDVLISPEDGPVEMFIRRRQVPWLENGETVFDLVSTDGKILSQDNRGDCIGYREGLAVVKNSFGIYCMTSGDKTVFSVNGTMVRGPAYNGLFHDGMLRVCDELGFYFYYVDREGRKKTRAYQYASDYHEERVTLAVEKPQRMKYQYGVLDKEGHWVVRPKYDYIASYHAFRARVLNKGKYGYIDRQGRLRVPMVWDDAWDFDDSGTAFVRMNYPPHACLIDREGQQLLQLPVDCVYAGSFYEDLLAAKTEEKWGYIDREGKWLIAPQYDHCGDFSNGVAPVERGGKWSFIDREGREVLALDGRLKIVARGLAHTEKAIYNYGYVQPRLKKTW